MMTRKKPRSKEVVTREIIDVDDDRDEPLPHMEDPDEETVDYVLKQFDDRDGLKLKYHICQPGGNALIGVYDDKLPEEQLQEWYPQGGKFEIKIYVHGEFRDRRYVMIAPRPGGLASNGNGHGGESSYLREMVMDLKNELRAMRQAAPQSSLTELATAMQALSNIQRPSESGTAFIEAIKLGISLASGKMPDEDESFGGVVKSVLKEAGPAVLQGLMAGRNGGGAPPPVAAALSPSPEEHMNLLLKSGIVFLKKKALAGADPGLYIDFALDNREDERFAPIIRAIVTQQFDVFASIDPEIAQPPYDAFFRPLYDGIRSAFVQTNPVVPAAGGTGGNVSDIADHAKSSKAGRKQS